jgi:hypothetical protein
MERFYPRVCDAVSKDRSKMLGKHPIRPHFTPLGAFLNRSVLCDQRFAEAVSRAAIERPIRRCNNDSYGLTSTSQLSGR